jgi:hypothetical protein
MTWICSFGIVNCPICQRNKDKIRSMVPVSIADKVIAKTDLHQEIEDITIEIIAGGEPKIEVKGKPLDKDGKPKIPVNIPSITGTWGIDKEPSDIGTFIDKPFTTSINEGNLPSMFTRSFFEPDNTTISWEDWPAYPMEPSSFSTGYRTIGGGTKKTPKNKTLRVDRLIPTSKLYKEMKDNDEPELFRKQGIKFYTARDGKKTMIVDSKSEIQF